jgi:UPF0271 protein
VTRRIDLNCDMGESFGLYKFGNDEIAVKYITAANVACGFHAGDPTTMKKTVDLLKNHNVAIGAHPGFPDVLGFGRRFMAISAEDARNYIIYQVGALKAFVEAVGLKLHHVKPHGALFTFSKFDDTLSRAVLEGIRAVDPNLLVYCPGPSWLFKYEEHAKDLGLTMVPEFYADLDYAADGQLSISKLLSHEDRSIDVGKCTEKVLRYLREGKVTKADGADLEFEAKSICIHGDTPNAGDLIRTLRTELDNAGIQVAPVKEIL